MNRFRTRMTVITVLFGTATLVRANELNQADSARGPRPGAMMVSVIKEARRAAPPQEPLLPHGKAVQFVERTRFSETEREQLRAFHRKYVEASQAHLPDEVACPQAQRYVQRILDRLIEGSWLRHAMQNADFPAQVVVSCGLADFPDAEIKAGVMEISAELILAMSTEDEIAAMMGHELAHYTLAHEAQKLQTHGRLSRYAALKQSIDHEFQADAEGLILLANAGYDPHAAVDALKVMRDILRARGWQGGAGHPDLNERVGRLTRQIARAEMQSLARRIQGLAVIHDELRRRPLALLKKREGAGFSH